MADDTATVEQLRAELRQIREERSTDRAEIASLREQQSATAEILRIIASSPTDLQVVLDALVRSAARLCSADNALAAQLDGDQIANVSATDPSHLGLRQQIAGTVTGRVLSERRTIHIYGSREEQLARYPESPGARLGYGAQANTPLLSGGHPIGTLNLIRYEPRPFTDAELALLETFADQAVIAIENARLFSELDQRNAELQESNRQVTVALEQQTATGEILRVIASSLTELPAVLNAVAQNAARLCDARDAIVYRVDGDRMYQVAAHGPVPGASDAVVGRGSVTGRAIVDRHTTHVHDLATVLEAEWPEGRALQRLYGHRTIVATPLLRQGLPIGAITIRRMEVRPFTDRQLELLETFADQAVIAIENARLFGELADLNQTLEARVGEQVGELERVGRLRRYLSPQLADLIVSSGDESILESHRRQISVLFCDLRGFTAFAETAEPEGVMGVLAEYHAAMGPLIHRFGGTLNHFVGDGLMVFFNDPLPQPDHAERAVRMACAMRERAAELQRGWRRGGYELGFGVGVAVGYATLGRIGFEGRYDYTAIGTVANLAARLCGEAADGQILVSARLHGMVEEMAVTETVGDLSLKGFQRPVETLNVTGLRNGERPDSLGTE